MSVYRSHHAAHDDNEIINYWINGNGANQITPPDWHEIVGESGEAGEGCLMTAVKAVGWALVAGAVIGLTVLGTFVTAFRWDLW